MCDSSMKGGERDGDRSEGVQERMIKQATKQEDQVKTHLEMCGVSRYFISYNYSVHTLQSIKIEHSGLRSHLQIWQWLRCTEPPSRVWCSSPFHVEGLCVPRSGSCPPAYIKNSGEKKGYVMVETETEEDLERKTCDYFLSCRINAFSVYATLIENKNQSQFYCHVFFPHMLLRFKI